MKLGMIFDEGHLMKWRSTYDTWHYI